MTTTTAASIASANCKPYLCRCSPYPSSVTKRKPILYPLSPPVISGLQAPTFRFSNQFAQLGFSPFSQWNGLRQLGISISSNFVKRERKGKCKVKGVYASLFGVGAPEALVIGVVALLVFGPKGLAELARTLGKTLRQFQPTIRELQEVSREFKSTLEHEIGLDELQSSAQNPYRSNMNNSLSSTQNTSSSNIMDSPSNPSSTASSEDSQKEVDSNGSPPPTREYSSEEYLKITEEQLKASAAVLEKQTSSMGENLTDNQAPSEDPVKKTAAVIPPPPKPENDA